MTLRKVKAHSFCFSHTADKHSMMRNECYLIRLCTQGDAYVTSYILLSCLFLCACTLGQQVRAILLLYMTGDVLRSYSFILEAVSKECLQETSLFDKTTSSYCFSEGSVEMRDT